MCLVIDGISQSMSAWKNIQITKAKYFNSQESNVYGEELDKMIKKKIFSLLDTSQ